MNRTKSNQNRNNQNKKWNCHRKEKKTNLPNTKEKKLQQESKNLHKEEEDVKID